MKRLGVVLALVFVLVLALVQGGCSAHHEQIVDDDHEFTSGTDRYKVTHEHGSSRLLLWRRDGITWRLVTSAE